MIDAMDKSGDMEIAINPDLLTVLLLYSPSGSFENCRCAIVSRDNVPTPESVSKQIIKEYNARKNNPRGETSDATFLNKHGGRDHQKQTTEVKDRAHVKKRSQAEFKCFVGKKLGHLKYECRFNKGRKQSAKYAKYVYSNVFGH